MTDPKTSSCYHCGEDIPPGFNAELAIADAPRSFCCYGCMAVAEMIVSGGLESFYQHRTETAQRPQEFSQTRAEELKLFDDPELQSEFIEAIEDQGGVLSHITLNVTGITCAACIWLLEKEVVKLAQVESLNVNHTTHKATLRFRQEQGSLSEVLIKMHQLGYPTLPYEEAQAKKQLDKDRRSALFRIAVAGIAAMQNMMFSVPLYLGIYSGIDQEFIGFFRWVSLLMATPVVFFSALPFYKAAWNALKVRQLNMDVPVSLAILAAYIASAYITVFQEPNLHSDVYFDSVAMFAFFLLVGRFLEMQTRHRHLNSDAEMTQLLPTTATLAAAPESETPERSIPAHKLQPGDHVVIGQGQVAPADGIVLEGASRFDESALTGEYLPLEKLPGDSVSAGTANIENTIVIKVSADRKHSRVAAIIRLLDSASAEKPETIKITDRIASYFVAFVLIASGLSGLYWYVNEPATAFAIMLSVLVVTCPCALSLATPTALTSANTALRKNGFLITKGHVLEAMSETTDVIFDKTGTLTEGRLEIQQCDCLGPYNQEQIFALVAALEAHSSHPIAKVFEPYFSIKAKDVKTELGKGVHGYINGREYYLGSHDYVLPSIQAINDEPQTHSSPHPGQCIYLSDGQNILARILLRDKVRAEARGCVSTLKRMGIRVHILSGDHAFSVRHTAMELGIEHIQSGQSPEQKLSYLRQLQKESRCVAMIGDGINDLPVLSGAQLSIAMGQASDLTKLNSDAILLNEHLDVLEGAFKAAQKTRKIIKENMAWALGYNLLMLPLAAAGWVPPYFAALGMSLSSLVVVFNSLRLRKLKTKTEIAQA